MAVKHRVRQCTGMMLVALLVSGCEDFLGSDGGTARLELFGLPTSDTLRHPGLEFAIEASGISRYTSVEVVVDAGTGDQRTFPLDSAWLAESPARVPVVIPAVLSNGRHVFTVRAQGAQGQRGTATFEYVVHVPDVAYSLQSISSDAWPDIRAADINATGAVAGVLYSASETSVVPDQPFVWEAGTMRYAPMPDGVRDVYATGMNDLGDVVGWAFFDDQIEAFHWWPGDSVRPLRAQNVALSWTVDIDNSRRVLVTERGGAAKYFVNANDGSATALGMGGYDFYMNQNMQAVGTEQYLYGKTVRAFGVTVQGPGERPGRHERYNRGVYWDIFGLGDAGEVLGSRHFDPFLSGSDTVQYIDQYVPPGQYRLSPAGEVVSLSGADSVFLWRRDAGTRRVRFANPGWTIDRLVGMNATGQIVANGVNTATSRRGVLLLTPGS